MCFSSDALLRTCSNAIRHPKWNRRFAVWKHAPTVAISLNSWNGKVFDALNPHAIALANRVRDCDFKKNLIDLNVSFD
jgi:hypothetical protein